MNKYTKEQMEGMFWWGVSLGKAQETAVENITTKALQDYFLKYISDLDNLPTISPSPKQVTDEEIKAEAKRRFPITQGLYDATYDEGKRNGFIQGVNYMRGLLTNKEDK